MRKVLYMLGQTWQLIREHKLYFLMPLLLCLCALAVLVFHLGPAIVISFIYAGV
jgi:hypothetical protein